MDWLELVYEILKVCVIPMFGILTTYLVKYVKANGEKIAIDVDNELAVKYITMLTSTISECVIATNQTYVDSLKRQGKFDMEAQKQAFILTYNAVLAILSDDAKKYLESAYGDLTLYLTQKIEAEVNANKM